MFVSTRAALAGSARRCVATLDRSDGDPLAPDWFKPFRSRAARLVGGTGPTAGRGPRPQRGVVRRRPCPEGDVTNERVSGGPLLSSCRGLGLGRGLGEEAAVDGSRRCLRGFAAECPCPDRHGGSFRRRATRERKLARSSYVEMNVFAASSTARQSSASTLSLSTLAGALLSSSGSSPNSHERAVTGPKRVTSSRGRGSRPRQARELRRSRRGGFVDPRQHVVSRSVRRVRGELRSELAKQPGCAGRDGVRRDSRIVASAALWHFRSPIGHDHVKPGTLIVIPPRSIQPRPPRGRRSGAVARLNLRQRSFVGSPFGRDGRTNVQTDGDSGAVASCPRRHILRDRIDTPPPTRLALAAGMGQRAIEIR